MCVCVCVCVCVYILPEANPIKFLQLLVQTTRINKKVKGTSKQVAFRNV